MTRSEAIRLAGVPTGNSHYSKINAAKKVWWLHIPLAKIEVGGPCEVNLLLFDQGSGELHHLCVPTGFLRTNVGRMHVREDKGVVSVELAVDEAERFRNVVPIDNGMSFAEFHVRTI